MIGPISWLTYPDYSDIVGWGARAYVLASIQRLSGSVGHGQFALRTIPMACLSDGICAHASRHARAMRSRRMQPLSFPQVSTIGASASPPVTVVLYWSHVASIRTMAAKGRTGQEVSSAWSPKAIANTVSDQGYRAFHGRRYIGFP